MAPGLPAIVPGAREDEFAGLADWRGRGEEVGGGGEPFVAGGYDAGAEGGGYEVWEGMLVEDEAGGLGCGGEHTYGVGFEGCVDVGGGDECC